MYQTHYTNSSNDIVKDLPTGVNYLINVMFHLELALDQFF